MVEVSSGGFRLSGVRDCGDRRGVKSGGCGGEGGIGMELLWGCGGFRGRGRVGVGVGLRVGVGVGGMHRTD